MHPGLRRTSAEEASVLFDECKMLRLGGSNKLARLNDLPERQVLVRHASCLLKGQVRVPSGDASPAVPKILKAPSPGPLKSSQGPGFGNASRSHTERDIYLQALADAGPVFIPVDRYGKGASGLKKEAHGAPGWEELAPPRPRRPTGRWQWFKPA